MQLGEVFAIELERVGGKAYLVADLEEARKTLQQIGRETGAGASVRWATPLAEALEPQATVIDATLPRQQARTLCLSASIGITEADHALADSGTLVLESGGGRSRMVSLLPPVHVALLPESRILENLGALVDRYKDGDGLLRLAAMSCLSFITGPSRTADIEQTLTVGVHGPQAVHVLVVRSL